MRIVYDTSYLDNCDSGRAVAQGKSLFCPSVRRAEVEVVVCFVVVWFAFWFFRHTPLLRSALKAGKAVNWKPSEELAWSIDACEVHDLLACEAPASRYVSVK